VLRRASEMTAQHPRAPGASGQLSELVVIEAATEAGIDPDAVRVSLAIERLGRPPTPERLDTTVGPRLASLDRIIALDPDTLLARVDDLLQRQHGLRRARSAADRGEWRKRTDALGRAQRVARASSGSARLGKLVRVEAITSAVDHQRTLIRLIADRRPQRSNAVTGGSLVGGVGMVTAGSLAIVTATPLVAAAAPVALAAGIATARTGRRQHHDLLTDLEDLLDAVERGTRPVTLSHEVRRALRNLRT
jgi:hypothetical protein